MDTEKLSVNGYCEDNINQEQNGDHLYFLVLCFNARKYLCIKFYAKNSICPQN